MDETTATLLLTHARAADRELNDALLAVKERCTDEEFLALRHSVAKILSGLFYETIRPVYQRHPHLAPSDLRPFLGEKK